MLSRKVVIGILYFLTMFANATIRVQPEMQEYLDFNFFKHDWSNSPYTGAKESIPDNPPPPKCKPLKMTMQANLNRLWHAICKGCHRDLVLP